jgi:hypothetical protein
LLADYDDPSFLFNATAFEIARRLKMEHTNSVHFVELYLNSELQGLYFVTEHLKGNVRANLEDPDNDVFMELDQ